MSGGHASSGTAARYSAAAVHLVFQTRPGTAADRRITAGGTATVTLHSGAVLEVAPVDGIYHFDMPDGDDAVFELFGTQYQVVRADGMARDPKVDRTLVVWSGALRPITDPDGILQRLQILGYNTDPVDMNMSAGAERGVLEFQADNGLVIDGDPGPRTRTKLDEVFRRSGYMAGTTQPLNRRYLVFFERAAYGTTRRDSPQIDFRGGDLGKMTIPLPLANPTSVPGVTPAATPERYRINCFPLNLDETSLPWHLSLRSGNATASLRSQTLFSFSDRIELAPVAEGEDILDVRQGMADGPLIASLDLKVAAMMEVKLWGHILTVEQIGTGARLADPPLWTRAEAQSLIDTINDIWSPAGISFVFRNFEEHTIAEPEPGCITDDFIHNRVRYRRIARTYNRIDFINVYFAQRVHQIYRDADGNIQVNEPIAYAGNRWRCNPSCVFTGKSLGLPELARALAHEFGHMLRLTAAAHSHSDDRGVPRPWRDDIWSRMRLMAMYLHYDKTFPDRNWQDTTYDGVADVMNAGDLITSKNLPHDDSDGEMELARSSADEPGARTGIASDD